MLAIQAINSHHINSRIVVNFAINAHWCGGVGLDDVGLEDGWPDGSGWILSKYCHCKYQCSDYS